MNVVMEAPSSEKATFASPLRTLTGILNGKVLNRSGKVKRLHLETVDGKFKVRVPKSLNAVAQLELEVGQPIRVWLDRDAKGTRALALVPLKPHQILPRSCVQSSPTCCILVCNSKSCCKRGGDELYNKLMEASASNPGLNIRKCGCLKQCDSGPNVKIRGKGVEPLKASQVPHLVEKLKRPSLN